MFFKFFFCFNLFVFFVFLQIFTSTVPKQKIQKSGYSLLSAGISLTYTKTNAATEKSLSLSGSIFLLFVFFFLVFGFYCFFCFFVLFVFFCFFKKSLQPKQKNQKNMIPFFVFMELTNIWWRKLWTTMIHKYPAKNKTN